MKNRRGVTLMELLIVASIIAMLLYAVMAILTGMIRQWNAQVSRAKAIETANAGMERMANEISTAVQYNAVDGSKVSTFNAPANIDAQGNYIPAWAGQTLSYALGGRVQFYLAASDGVSAGNILWRCSNPSASGNGGSWVNDTKWSLNAVASTHGRMENVTALTFTPVPSTPNTVTVSITVTYKEGGTTSVYTLTRDIYMANHN